MSFLDHSAFSLATAGRKGKATPHPVAAQSIPRKIDKRPARSGKDVAAAHQVSQKMHETPRQTLDRSEFIATPATPNAVWAAGLDAPAEIAGKPALPRDHGVFTPQINHVGIPTTSNPSGTDRAATPLGLHIVEPAERDMALAGLARTLKQILKEISPCAFC